jgi:hypothetical protein
VALTAQQQLALGNLAGLRRDGDTWREATASELQETPSPLRDHYAAQQARIRATAAFLDSVDRTESLLSRTTVQRTAEGVAELLDQLLEEA